MNSITPAKAGVHLLPVHDQIWQEMDPGFRRDDE
jgi:hypothetical protein